MENSSLVALLLIWFLGTSQAYAQMRESPPANDAQITAIVSASNENEINAGKLARAKATSKEVKAFADKMVSDHMRLEKSSSEVAAKAKIKPEESAVSQKLKSDAEQTVKQLKDMKGADFDKAYLEAEVAGHQKVLDMVDKNLIPNAKNPELKAELQKARPVIADHLDHAKQLQSGAGGSK